MKAKASELRSLGMEELEAKEKDLRQEHLSFRFRHATAQLENTASLRQVRKAIARVMTVIRERKSKGQGSI